MGAEELIGGLIRLLATGLIFITVLEALELLELPTLFTIAQAPSEVPKGAGPRPFVSLHVPICSEPPEVVTRTLLALSRLDYERYEVVVVDNNTPDRALWEPIRDLCCELGPKFRFYHLGRWPGFKAGALNFARRRTSPEASIVGVVDSDYEVEARYLSETVGFFDDPALGFVQTPQDYRGWCRGVYARMCYWEYWQFFSVGMLLRARRNAILLHGTMGLVRLDALDRAGGWAEWCLTEDSELGLRLLAAGFAGVYVFRTYGRGLMPCSYRSYRRQRRRWVVGGAQTLRRHWRLFLPFDRQGLSPSQRLHYLQGWLPWLRDGLIISAAPITVASCVAALSGNIGIEVVSPLGVGLGLVLLHGLARHALIYRVYLACAWKDVIGASVAIFGLTWTIGLAWLSGCLDREHIFHRTPKKREPPMHWLGELGSELALAAMMTVLGVALLAKFGLKGWMAVGACWTYAATSLASIQTAHAASAGESDPETVTERRHVT